MRTILDRLLFQQQDLKKPVAVLSGGERMRLGFAKLMVGSSNLLLLDEPTNYLDLPSIRCITKLLQNYEEVYCLYLMMRHLSKRSQLRYGSFASIRCTCRRTV